MTDDGLDLERYDLGSFDGDLPDTHCHWHDVNEPGPGYLRKHGNKRKTQRRRRT